MAAQRDIVEYALQRRALLGEVATGRRSRDEACDAHPYLLLAAKHYGEPVSHPCPVCAHNRQRHVHYVYGQSLGSIAGQAKSVGELAQLGREREEFEVYVVEVCPDCRWNHLVRSFVLGLPAPGALTAADG
ncbi:MAG TPA: DUF5318 family protein [Jatrophihabitantaceae bacterium]|nr:DUF5318 family protein [Jatrophihabitantaceae bacterium]